MKKYFLLIVLFFVINVNAATCDKNELARLKNIAKNVEISYTYEIKEKKENGKVLYKYSEYTLHANNLNNELRALIYQDYYQDKYKTIKNNNGIGMLSPFYGGENIDVTLEAYTNNGCSGEKLLTKKITLPYYNSYSENDDCVGDIYKDSECCNELLEKNYKKDDDFKQCLTDYYFNRYIKSAASTGSGEEEIESLNYMMYILIAAVILVLIVIMSIFVKRHNKNKI